MKEISVSQWLFPCLAILVARLFPNTLSPTSLVQINQLFLVLFLRDLRKNSSLSSVSQCLIFICETTVHIFTLSLNSFFIYIKIILWKFAMKIKVGFWKDDCVDNNFVSWRNYIWICAGVWFTVVETKTRDQSKLIEGRDWYFQYSLNTDPVFNVPCSFLSHSLLLCSCTLNTQLQWNVSVFSHHSIFWW